MYHTKISNDLLRSKDLKANTLRVLLVIMSYEGEKGYSYPSHKRLEDETGLAKNTLLKSINELVEKGYISKEKGEGTNNKYRINNSIKIDTTNQSTSIKNDTALDETSIKNDTAPVLKLIHENKQENNKDKKEKEKKTNLDKIISTYTENDDLVEAIKDFIKMRKAIGKLITDRALKGILKKLDMYGQDDLEKIEILENSIENCWQGVFELKNKKAPTAIGGDKKYNYNSSICNNGTKNTQRVEIINNF